MIKQHLLAVYIIIFHFLQAIIKLEKFIFVKTTSKEKIPKKEGIGAELSSLDGIAKRLFSDTVPEALQLHLSSHLLRLLTRFS